MPAIVNMIMLSSIAMGTTIALSSSHWFLAWMGLEMNTLAAVALICKAHHPRASEAAAKYFLIQAAGAAVLLFAAWLNASMTGSWQITHAFSTTPAVMAVLAITLKMGIAPLHSWLPEVLQGVDLFTGLLLSTLQKVAPLVLLSQLQSVTPLLLIFIGLISIVMGGLGALNQTQLRKILAYSSIAHMGWMVLAMICTPDLVKFTFAIYVVLTASTFLCFIVLNSKSIGGLLHAKTKTAIVVVLCPLVLLSLGGLPPLSGFLPKLMILADLSNQGLVISATMAALAALLSLFVYAQLAVMTTLLESPGVHSTMPGWRLFFRLHSMPVAVLLTVAIFILPGTPALICLII